MKNTTNPLFLIVILEIIRNKISDHAENYIVSQMHVYR